MHSTNKSMETHILVVDDEPENRLLLRDILEEDGYPVREACDGLAAIQSIRETVPTLVLLDVMMPGLDGLEVCRSLKADTETAHIPVILVTAQRHRDERIAGIEAGARDFLTKPIDIMDLRLRVRNAVRTQTLYDNLEREYTRVTELEKMRDQLVHMIVHDLRSPLHVMGMNIEVVEMEAIGMLDGEDIQALRDVRMTVRSMSKMVDTMLDLSRLESKAMPINKHNTDLGALVSEAAPGVGDDTNPVYLDIPSTEEFDPMATCDSELIKRVVVNLVNNAIDFSPKDEPVIVSILQVRHGHRVTITDRGPGIPQNAQDTIFDKFGQASQHGRRTKASSGIGLAFCKLAVESHGGEIGVQSNVGEGSTFWFELPAWPNS